MTTNDMNTMAAWLKEHDDIMICAHVSPDGDTLGSSLALQSALRSMGKRVCVACQDTPPYLYDFLDDYGSVCKPESLPFTPKAALYCDCSDLSRTGSCASVHCDARAVIDHHATNDGFCDVTLIDSDASATGVLVVELLKLMGIPLTRVMAGQLYTAITTDTGNFSFKSTDGRTLRAAADCADCGIDIGNITRILFRLRSLPRVRLLGRALDDMLLTDGGRIALLPVTPRMIADSGAAEADTEGIVNFGIETDGVVLAALLRVRNGDVKVSLRSLEPYNAARVAVTFGGGGHDLAAGCTIRNSTIEAAQAQVLTALRDELKFVSSARDNS